MRVSDFRDSLVDELTSRGTPEGVDQLRRVAAGMPHLTWLPAVVQRARRTALERTWVHPDPGEVLDLVARADRPLVRSGAELLRAVSDALERLEQGLRRGATPAAVRFWSDRKEGRRVVYRPRSDEPLLSDEVARHLREDLGRWGVDVVVTREEETRPSVGRGTGQKPDLVVSKSLGHTQTLSCAVEVKGCFHEEVQTAMATQLVGRYLKSGAFHGGIYLVVWFDQNSWDPEDRDRRARVPWSRLREAREALDRQARDLAGDPGWLRAVVLDASLAP